MFYFTEKKQLDIFILFSFRKFKQIKLNKGKFELNFQKIKVKLYKI
jgi:hypothetical protein